MTSIIVVNWNTRAVTERCLRSVLRHTARPFQLVLVDNGSTDGSADALEPLLEPGDRLLRLPSNLGFAGGANRGLDVATGTRIVLLNSDTVVTPRWLGRLHRRMDRTGAGLVGPCTDHAKGKQRRKPWWGRIPPPFRRNREVAYLSFFCVLVDRRVLDAIGPLDERFGPGTFEDDDWCRRARAAGFRLEIAGQAWVWHEAHATFRANALDDRALQAGNRALYDAKWGDQA